MSGQQLFAAVYGALGARVTSGVDANGAPAQVYTDVQVDANGVVSVGGASMLALETALALTNSNFVAPDNSSSVAFGVSKLVSAVPVSLCSYMIKSKAVTDGYLQFFDKAALPVLLDVPVLVVDIKAGLTVAFSYNLPRAFTTGISVGVSTTAATYTAFATNDFWFDIQYKQEVL